VRALNPYKHNYKKRIVDEKGQTIGYECTICGFRVTGSNPRNARVYSSAITNHIKSKHPVSYILMAGHAPVWRWTEDRKKEGAELLKC